MPVMIIDPVGTAPHRTIPSELVIFVADIPADGLIVMVAPGTGSPVSESTTFTITVPPLITPRPATNDSTVTLPGRGMVHATVPVFGRSPVSGEISGDGTRGLVFDADDHDRLAALVVDLIGDRERWASMATASRDYAGTMTLEAFQDRVRELLELQWQVSLPEPSRPGAGT